MAYDSKTVKQKWRGKMDERIAFRIDKSTRDRCAKHAEKLGITESHYIRLCLYCSNVPEYIEQNPLLKIQFDHLAKKAKKAKKYMHL